MSDTNFITLSDLKAETAIQSNVESALLMPYVALAQTEFITKELGITLTEQLTAEINLWGISGLTGSSLSLINYIKKPLCYYTFYKAFPYIGTKFTNKGIVKMLDDNAENVSDEKEKELRADIKNTAESEHNKLRLFLYQNKELFPTWRELGDSSTEYPSNESAPQKRYNSGVHFRKKSKYYREED